MVSPVIALGFYHVKVVIKANQDISFVNYRDVNEQDATFLKSFKLSSNYLKNIALSERKITMYELNKLMEIANEIKKDENEKNITSIFKK